MISLPTGCRRCWIGSRSGRRRTAARCSIHPARNDTFYFSQLGTFLERADNTARILDVKYFVLLRATNMIGSSVDNLQGLRSCDRFPHIAATLGLQAGLQTLEYRRLSHSQRGDATLAQGLLPKSIKPSPA